MERYDLPEGWEWKRLGDLCEIAIGKTPKRSEPRYWGGDNRWAIIADLNNGVVAETKEHITDVAVLEECRGRLVRAGTLLMSFKLSIGKVAFAECDLYTNEAIAALPIRDETVVDKKYLLWCLKIVTLDTEADEAVKGKTLNKAKLKRLKIPLPPLDEQRRIVRRIEEISRRVEEARRLQQETQAQLDKVIPSVLSKAFRGEL
jgi:type I restriction enzyme S subunit